MSIKIRFKKVVGDEEVETFFPGSEETKRFIAPDRRANVDAMREALTQIASQLPWAFGDMSIALEAMVESAAAGWMTKTGWSVEDSRAKLIEVADRVLAELDERLVAIVDIAISKGQGAEVPADIMAAYRRRRGEGEDQ